MDLKKYLWELDKPSVVKKLIIQIFPIIEEKEISIVKNRISVQDKFVGTYSICKKTGEFTFSPVNRKEEEDERPKEVTDPARRYRKGVSKPTQGE